VRALVVAASDPIGAMQCIDGASCLDQMNRILVMECGECLAKRTGIRLPTFPSPQYKPMPPMLAPSQPSANDCSVVDVEMFCMSEAFEAKFFQLSPLFTRGQQCFPYIEEAKFCKVAGDNVFRMYRKSVHALANLNTVALAWTTDLDHFSDYAEEYRKGRNGLVHDCVRCIRKAVSEYTVRPTDFDEKVDAASAYARKTSGLLATYRQPAAIARLQNQPEKERKFQKMVKFWQSFLKDTPRAAMRYQHRMQTDPEP
jgi:hypothetical protein